MAINASSLQDLDTLVTAGCSPCYVCFVFMYGFRLNYYRTICLGIEILFILFPVEGKDKSELFRVDWLIISLGLFSLLHKICH